MDRFHRYYKLHALLGERRLPVTRLEIERELECSRATARRIIDDLRCYGAPIEYVRANGYRYNRDVAFELPGIWFTPSELFALLAAHQLLAQAEPGLLDTTLEPLRRHVSRMLSAEHLGDGELVDRVKMMRVGGRGVGPAFLPVIKALATRKQFFADYRARGDDATEQRQLSPQRIVHYRDNWYLDAWCHGRKALRRFALERLADVRQSDKAARNVAQVAIDAHFGANYGIFAGTESSVATLAFQPHRARWVADEEWHPQQQGSYRSDGRYELRVPYSDSRELIMDILRNGDEVEVLGPPALRAQVASRLQRASAIYLERLTE